MIPTFCETQNKLNTLDDAIVVGGDTPYIVLKGSYNERQGAGSVLKHSVEVNELSQCGTHHSNFELPDSQPGEFYANKDNVVYLYFPGTGQFKSLSG